jgi:carbonic anhydrase
MRLVEAILDANHRALAGDSKAGLHPAEFENELPLVALTCVDVRLNTILPQVLGVPPEQFIWLRNAGNIITGPQSSTMRSLALACAVKGGREIVIIGHTDCQVGKTSTMQLLEELEKLGVKRHVLPDNINEFFGIFGSERQNVIKAANVARSSPLIGPQTPVHGLLVDTESGRLEWLVNGYELGSGAPPDAWGQVVSSGQQTLDALKNFAEFKIGEMKFPETKIGEVASKVENWVAQKLQSTPPPPLPAAPAQPEPPRLPLPPPIRPKILLRKKPR